LACGLFVTATDTGVGKTLISSAIVRLLRASGRDAVGFKPAATGSDTGKWGDAQALFEASDRCEPISNICPQCFHAPLAPTLAAWHEGRECDAPQALRVLDGLRERHNCVIVEGIGGLLVPLDRNTLILDFAARTGFPVLLVCRAGLGTINHTLLTLREIERAGLPFGGLIMNVTRPADADMVEGAKSEIERVSGRKIRAVVPYLEGAGQDSPPAETIARAMSALNSQINIQSLIGGG
jgi:dethiobiotin synthetase